MNPPETNDPLDALLREEPPHIADDGFTARVLASLPPRRKHSRLRTILLLATTGLSSVLAVLWLPWSEMPALTLSVMHGFDVQALLTLLLMMCVVATLFWGALAIIPSEDYD